MIRVLNVFDPYYHAYYLRGLADTYGFANLHFVCKGFPRFARTGLAFEMINPPLRVYIDADDFDGLDKPALQWCDIYGKVNVNPNIISANDRDKVVPLGPSFGIRERKLLRVFPLAQIGTLVYRGGERSTYTLLKRWWWMLNRRLPIRTYKNSTTSQNNYIFLASSVWAPADNCNLYRARFVEVASNKTSIKFEGGFVPPYREDVPECVMYRIKKTYSISEYLVRTRASTLVFNTPAVLDCHGWKLGEYLALGKAILTTPLTRDLPAPLETGQHLHVVDGSTESINDGIDRLCKDPQYRYNLEIKARAYYEEFLTPRRAIARLVNINFL